MIVQTAHDIAKKHLEKEIYTNFELQEFVLQSQEYKKLEELSSKWFSGLSSQEKNYLNELVREIKAYTKKDNSVISPTILNALILFNIEAKYSKNETIRRFLELVNKYISPRIGFVANGISNSQQLNILKQTPNLYRTIDGWWANICKFGNDSSDGGFFSRKDVNTALSNIAEILVDASKNQKQINTYTYNEIECLKNALDRVRQSMDGILSHNLKVQIRSGYHNVCKALKQISQ